MPTPEERAEKKCILAEAKVEAKRLREEARRAKAAEYCTKILGGRMGPAPVVDVHIYGKEATVHGLRFASEWKGPTPNSEPTNYRLAPHGC